MSGKLFIFLLVHGLVTVPQCDSRFADARGQCLRADHRRVRPQPPPCSAGSLATINDAPYSALLVEATYEDVKSFYHEDLCTAAHPNAVSGSLDAVEARFGIPVIYTSQHRPLAAEKAASWLSKHFTYWYLEKEGLGRVLQTGDL